jgi:hypothetical protein
MVCVKFKHFVLYKSYIYKQLFIKIFYNYFKEFELKMQKKLIL